MRNAPSVEYPVGRCVFQRRLESLLACTWLVVQLGWWGALGFVAPPGAWWFATVAGVSACGMLVWRARQPVNGLLCWDGLAQPRGQWRWVSAAYSRGTVLENVQWALDLQAVALVRVKTVAGLTLWLWLDRQSQPQHWDELRRALQSYTNIKVSATDQAATASR